MTEVKRQMRRSIILILTVLWINTSSGTSAFDVKVPGVRGGVMIGYRLQHMSNAGLYRSNPGINIHLLGIGYRF